MGMGWKRVWVFVQSTAYRKGRHWGGFAKYLPKSFISISHSYIHRFAGPAEIEKERKKDSVNP